MDHEIVFCGMHAGDYNLSNLVVKGRLRVQCDNVTPEYWCACTVFQGYTHAYIESLYTRVTVVVLIFTCSCFKMIPAHRSVYSPGRIIMHSLLAILDTTVGVQSLYVIARVYYQEYATATGYEIRHWAFATSQQCVDLYLCKL